MKWFLPLVVFLSLMMLTGCDDEGSSGCSSHTDCNELKVCDGGSCISPDISPEISIQYLSSGDTLNGYEFDEDPATPGIQTTIFVTAKDLPEDSTITLNIKNGSEVTEDSTVKDGKAVFTSITLPAGEIKLQVSGKDKYDRIINSEELSLTIEEATIVFTEFFGKDQSPISLTSGDDQDPVKFYIQREVELALTGVNDGLPVKLYLYDAETSEVKEFYQTTITNGTAKFPGVSFPKGEWRLVASFENYRKMLVQSEAVLVSSEALPGQCNVDIITPEESSVINQEYLATDAAEGKAVMVKIETDCPENFTVQYQVNGSEVETGTLTAEGDKFVAETTLIFPENKDQEGDSTLLVNVINPNDDKEGGNDTAHYTIDTIAPVLELDTPVAGQELFPGDDLDGSKNGIQIYMRGRSDDAVGGLTVVVDEGTPQLFPGAFNPDSETPSHFNTENNSDNPYVTLANSGTQNIVVTAEDQYGNEGSITVSVRGYVGASLVINQIGSQNISGSTLTLNQSDDSSSTLENLQTVVRGSAAGFDSGRVINLLRNDGILITKAQVNGSNSVEFPLDTATLGLPNGTYDLYMETENGAGHAITSAKIKLTVSTTKPVLTLRSHTSGTFIKDGTITLELGTQNLTPGTDQVVMSFNGTETRLPVQNDGSVIFSNVELQQNNSLPYTPNQFTFNATDIAGNQAEELSLTLNYDPDTPIFEITSPAKTELTREDDTSDTIGGIQTVVTILVSNESPGGMATLYLNDQQVGDSVALTATGNGDETTAVFNDVSLISGASNSLKVVVTDQAGNQSEKSTAVTVDDGCYALQFGAPTTNGAFLNDTSYQGTVHLTPLGSSNHIPDGLTLNLSLNSQSYQATSASGGGVFGSVGSPIPLVEGGNSLVVSYNVDASTSCQLSATINYDTGKPVVSQVVFIDQNDQNHSASSGATLYMGTIYDRSASSENGQLRARLSLDQIEAGEDATLIIDSDTGNPVTAPVSCDQSGENCFAELDFTLVEGGPYQLQFQVEDRSGNLSDPYQITAYLDLTAPQVAFESDFPAYLNNSPGVDANTNITGLQYNVVAELSDVASTDTVRFYIHHSDYQGDSYLADMYYDADNNGSLDQVKAETALSNSALCTQNGENYTCTFRNVTFPLSGESGYTIELVVEDLAGNQTTVSKENYKVENALTVSFVLTSFLTEGNQTNLSPFNLQLTLNRAETGNVFLDLMQGATLINTEGPVSLVQPNTVSDFQVTFPSDGRYELKPRFVDQFNFTYEGLTGYIAYKGTAPALVYGGKTTFNRSDLNGSNQFDMTLQINDFYLDNKDFTKKPVTVELRQNNSTGAVITSSVIPENGTLNLSVPLPEGKNYSVVLIKNGAGLKDNFGNNINNNSLGTFLVDVTNPVISSVSANNGANSKGFSTSGTTTIVIADQVDKNTGTTDLETDLVIYVGDVNGDGGTVQLTNLTGSPSGTISGGEVTFSDLTLSAALTQLDITVTDLAGNSISQTLPLVIDLDAPSVSISSVKSDFVGNDDVNSGLGGFQIDLGITASGADTVEVERSGSIDFSSVSSLGSQSGALTSREITLPEGTSYLRVIATDDHGNETTSNTLTVSVTLDSCVLTAVSKGGEALIGSTNYFNSSDVSGGEVTLAVQTSAACNGYTFEVTKGGSAITGSPFTISTTSQNFTLSVADGESFNLTVTLPDFTGETATYPVSVDTTAPALASRVPSETYNTLYYVNSNNINLTADEYIADKDGNSGNGAQIDLSFTSSGAAGGTVELFNGATSLGTANIPSSGGETVNFENLNLTHGASHSMKAVITDLAGNTVEHTFTAVVDVMRPDAPATFSGGALTDTQRRQASLSVPFTWTASGDDGTSGTVDHYTVKYQKGQTSIDDAGFEAVSENITTISNGTLTSQSITGFIYHNDYTVAIRAYDEVGNYSDITTDEINYTLKSYAITHNFSSTDTLYQIKDVGDINGDGNNDFVATQAYLDTYDGQVVIYYGNADGTVDPPAIIGGEAGTYEALGISVTSADFDGDGDKDLIVGAEWQGYFWDGGDYYKGGVYVFWNPGDGTSVSAGNKILITNSALTSATIKPESYYFSGRFGIAVDSIGDLDGDGKEDIVIGADNIYQTAAQTNSGAAFIVKGRTAGDISGGILDVATDSGIITLLHNFGNISKFGTSVSGLGNIDQSGSVDVAVGDPLNKKVVIYHLTAASSGTINSTDSGVVVLGNPAEKFGQGVKGNIDLNGDGFLDLIVEVGGSYLMGFLGDGSQFAVDETNSFITANTNGETNFLNNWSVADYDGDGNDDLTIGMTGKVYIYLHPGTGAIEPDVVINKGDSNIYKAAGFDLNSDNIADFITCDTTNRLCEILY